ncbi:MAG: hypothetical protein H6Q75_1665 [Firmicutes bacterium]|nr:hypothetical protein [Bacillota bacterium]
MKKWLACLVLGGCLAFCAVALAQPEIPPPPTSSIYVQDYAGVIDAETKSRINNVGSQLDAKTRAQVVVVTVNSTEDLPIEDYALEILRKWGVGDKKLNNGVVIVVAVADHKSRIEVGYGLEGRLPDAKTGRIQDEYMLSYFQKGAYSQGILNGYMAVSGEVAKEYNLELKTDAKAVRQTKQESTSLWAGLPWWLKLVLAAGMIGLVAIDWLFFGGMFTFMLLALFRRGGGGGGGGSGGYGGGSGGGGGSSRNW